MDNDATTIRGAWNDCMSDRSETTVAIDVKVQQVLDFNNLFSISLII